MSMRHPSGFIRPGYDPLEVADAPTGVTPTAGNQSASVDFTPPADVGGAAVSEYYAVVQPGNITATSVTPPVAVSGLTNGTEYTTKVWANNSYGPSPYSAESSGFTPAPDYVEDVFSTYLYTGNGFTQTITNGIDLAGEGGLVWQKWRNASSDHWWIDTARGIQQSISSNNTDAQQNKGSSSLTSFNSNGFTVGSYFGTNTIASWTFRKAPKFFDVVTYTGNGVAGRQIPHNLGSVPGTIIVKSTNNSVGWAVYHRSLGATKYLTLNLTDEALTNPNYWNDTEPTSTNFTVAGTFPTNRSDYTYVAYLFAHDAGGFGDDGTENVISCGSYVEPNNGSFVNVNLGFEPQWLLVKCIDQAATPWNVIDNMRGMVLGAQTKYLIPNTSDAEQSGFANAYYQPTATGFTAGNTFVGGGGKTIVYVAIRRGPMNTPEAGTEVFGISEQEVTSGNVGGFNAGFVADASLRIDETGDNHDFNSRLSGTGNLITNSTSAETSLAWVFWDYQDGFGLRLDPSATNKRYLFRRAPGFFDVVAYTGTGSARTVAHNLGVVPELMIVKTRSNAVGWAVSCGAVGYTNGGRLELTDPFYSEPNRITGTPTTTTFPVGTDAYVNVSARTYVAYLFASLPGVSKVSSYTGTGADLNVDCGFSAGARFILIKRTDSTGDWYVWDSARGITAGNDPYLLLNTTDAEVTGTDYIDPLSSGFTVTSSAPAALNASGGTYIFLAIA